MHPEDHHRARITKLDKDFARDLDFKDIYFQLKLETFWKLKKRVLLPLVFLVMKIRKNIQSMYQKKCCEKNSDLLLIGEEVMFLSNILIHLCMVIHYTGEENTLPLLFTSFQWRRNIKTSYLRLL